MATLETAWQEAVFALYLSEGKIEPEVVENMRTWQHSGFSVDHVSMRIRPLDDQRLGRIRHALRDVAVKIEYGDHQASGNGVDP